VCFVLNLHYVIGKKIYVDAVSLAMDLTLFQRSSLIVNLNNKILPNMFKSIFMYVQVFFFHEKIPLKQEHRP
jgi:hypothetical protein